MDHDSMKKSLRNEAEISPAQKFSAPLKSVTAMILKVFRSVKIRHSNDLMRGNTIWRKAQNQNRGVLTYNTETPPSGEHTRAGSTHVIIPGFHLTIVT
jgi:hypothetical protein